MRRERRRAFAARLVADWYAPRLTLLTSVLTPLAALFGAIAAGRRALYRGGLLASVRLPVPVIVVGNLSVGGTGKTPLTIALAHALARRGRQPGVVSRGYGRSADAVRLVRAGDAVGEVGDEPLLIANAGLRVAVGRHRAAAARALLETEPRCDVLIADDGLQHYALARDMEIAVVDGMRGFGNGWTLPAGPLREPPRRRREVDAVVINAPPGGAGAIALPGAFTMHLVGDECVNLADPSRRVPVAAFAATRVHAIAGIGNPERFFAMLRDAGLDVIAHAYPDHHALRAHDLACPAAQVILMTEKDAVKCAGFADARCWFVPVHAVIDEALVERVLARLPC